MKYTPRKFSSVLQEMISNIPETEERLINALNWLAHDSAYKAPEQLQDYWIKTSHILYEEFGPIEKLTEDWKIKVTEILLRDS